MIRAMALSDVSRVAEIHVFGWRDAYRCFISDDFLFKSMLVSKRIDVFDNSVRNNAEENYVYDDGIIKAFLTIGRCRDEDKPESFELWGIYVDPFMKRQGIGSKMVEYCENRALERGFQEVCLWVFKENMAARLFYEKLGYLPDNSSKYIEFLSATEIRFSKRLCQ